LYQPSVSGAREGVAKAVGEETSTSIEEVTVPLTVPDPVAYEYAQSSHGFVGCAASLVS
jgi:hypothetical protein